MVTKLSTFLYRTLQNTQHPKRQASIFPLITLNIIFVVLITVIFSGIPVMLLFRFQLDNYAFLQVQNAQSATQALYEAEKNKLLNLVVLVSERPTLISILRQRDLEALRLYLDSLVEETPAYRLGIIGQDIEYLQGDILEMMSFPTEKMPFVDLISLKDPNRVAIIAANRIALSEDQAAENISLVVGMQIINDEFMRTLSQQTGLEQSLIVEGKRDATSFTNIIDWPLDPSSVSLVMSSLSKCCSEGYSEDKPYYVGLSPLIDNQGNVIAVSEIALPGTEIQKITNTSIIYLLGANILIALIGVILAMLFTRRLTQPLRRIAKAAEQMGYGDLTTSIPVNSGWIEIDQLAAQLERSRKYLKQIIFFNRSELRRIVHLLGAIHEGVVILNEKGEVTWFNLETIRITGYSGKDLFQKHYSQVFRSPFEAVPPLNSVLEAPKNQEQTKQITVLNAQDNPITLAVSVTCLEDEEGIEPGVSRVLTLRDISKDLEVYRLRNDFLSYIAHEFHTPLATISAAIELLEEDTFNLSPQEIGDLVRSIRLSSTHLNTLVNNLLESTVIEAGCFQLNFRSIRFSNMLQNVIEIMTPLINRRQQKLVLDSRVEIQRIWADPDRLQQALVNILDNASKFSPIGIYIILKVHIVNSRLLFTVLDSGPGFSSGQIKNRFIRFGSGDHPQGAPFGIGLGLPVVKAIVEAHGGEVGAENRPEGGAKVWFSLPLKSKSSVEDELWRRYL